MSTALTPIPTAPLSITETRRSADMMIAQRAAIVDCMSKVMRKDIDYGIVPGTDKPSLLKPGSEKILALFNLAAQPQVEDLSTPDSIRYLVTITVIHTPSGTVVGYGVGEASSAESKYQWRSVVCQEEWDEIPEDRRRTKWKKGYGKNLPYSVQQVRAEMEDVANTVLKMAKKRAQIDAVLTATAASDVFAQDLDELLAAGLDISPEIETTQADSLPQELQRKTSPPQSPTGAAPAANHSPSPASRASATTGPRSSPQAAGQTITSPQASRFWAIAMKTHGDHHQILNYLRNVLGVNSKDFIPTSRYEEAICWAEGKQGDA